MKQPKYAYLDPKWMRLILKVAASTTAAPPPATTTILTTDSFLRMCTGKVTVFVCIKFVFSFIQNFVFTSARKMLFSHSNTHSYRLCVSYICSKSKHRHRQLSILTSHEIQMQWSFNVCIIPKLMLTSLEWQAREYTRTHTHIHLGLCVRAKAMRRLMPIQDRNFLGRRHYASCFDVEQCAAAAATHGAYLTIQHHRRRCCCCYCIQLSPYYSIRSIHNTGVGVQSLCICVYVWVLTHKYIRSIIISLQVCRIYYWPNFCLCVYVCEWGALRMNDVETVEKSVERLNARECANFLIFLRKQKKRKNGVWVVCVSVLALHMFAMDVCAKRKARDWERPKERAWIAWRESNQCHGEKKRVCKREI